MKIGTRLVLVIMLSISMTLTITAQDDTTEDDSASEEEVVSSEELTVEWECPSDFSGETLYVWNWSDYISEDTIPRFEEICDVTVVYETYDDDLDMIKIIRRGSSPYGVVFPGNENVPLMIGEQLLYELNHDNIPNLSNLIPRFRTSPQDPDNRYAVPYQWGTIAIGYNTNEFPDGISSWNDVFTHDGPVGWLNMPQMVMTVAMLNQGKDLDNLTIRDIEEARDFLISRATSNVEIVSDDDGQDLLADGTLDIVIEWSGDIASLNDDCGCEDFVYHIPDEGANLWFDAMAIPVDAPNPELSEAFIDYILDPIVSAEISNSTAYASPNAQSRELGLIDDNLVNNPGLYPPAEMIENLFYLRVPRPRVAEVYQNSWDELRILLSND